MEDIRTKEMCEHRDNVRGLIRQWCEAFETEARRGFSPVRPTQAYLQSVEEAELEKPRRARESDAGAGMHEYRA